MAIPDAGVIENGAHVYPVRVYFEDTDSGGIVYYANYLRYAERARTEMLRCVGYPHAKMMSEKNLVFAVRRCEVDYIKPAHLDDALEIYSGNVEIKAASLWIDQTIRRKGEDIAQLRVRLACVGDAGKPKRLPSELRDVFLPLLAVNNSKY
ncbi:MAG: tol-pal system-associated acyl-CoA thioesterase [Alphaproteobacteria bacterium]